MLIPDGHVNKSRRSFLQLTARLHNLKSDNFIFFPLFVKKKKSNINASLALHTASKRFPQVHEISSYFPSAVVAFTAACAWLQGNEARKYSSILHDPHDLVEENPIGQPQVAISGGLGN